MKVYVKNKLASVRGSSSVTDGQKNPVYEVKGKFFSISHKKRVYDAKGNLLYQVRNKLVNIFTHKAFIYDANGTKIAKVKNRPFRKGFTVEGYRDEISIEGAFFSLTSQIIRNGKPIGVIRRNINLFVDSFELEAEEQDIPFLVALIIAIDNICDNVRS